ncbi:MAG TPA: tetratricopeptide repeat protein [Devosia sp.]|nr:tetratricopeptide repeat protein [Devosia sp.]
MSSETIFSEVDEDLRRDRMRQLWRTAGPWIIGGAVLVVLVVAGYEGWTWWTKSQSAKWSDQFYAAMETATGTDAAATDKALADLIAQTGGGYPMLAQFRQAGVLAQQGKVDEAVAAYDGLASTQNDTHLRELALILAGNLLIDKGDVEAVRQRVGGMVLPESPMHNAANEVLGLAQYKAGKLDDAMVTFKAIVDDPVASRDLRGRVQLYMAQLIAEGAKQPAAEAPAASAPAVDGGTELDVTPSAAEVSSGPTESSGATDSSSAPAN